jgi:hypothetical protein
MNNFFRFLALFVPRKQGNAWEKQLNKLPDPSHLVRCAHNGNDGMVE